MGLFALEHSRAASRADLALHGGAVVGLAAYLLVTTPPAWNRVFANTSALALAGLVGWTLIEYLVHRFVLHHLPPFRGWHARHHLRPTALIYAPTVLIAALIAALVFLPAWWLGGLRQASALTLGLLIGYLAYSITHHATHHWRADGAWLKRRKRWHALHHQQPHLSVAANANASANANANASDRDSATTGTAPARSPPGVCFGVTTSVWDTVFGSAGRAASRGNPHRGRKKIWHGA